VAKSTGLGDDFFFGGFHIGNNVTQLDNIHGGPAAIPATDITQFGMARLGGLRDGGMQVTLLMDPAAAQEHAALSPLPTGDVIMTYLRGQAIGNPAASCLSKQLNYDPTRAADGALTFKAEGQGNGYGLEWGKQLTAGLRTDTTATNGTSLDTGGSLSFGAQMYVHLVGFTGTSVTIALQDSADNSTFAAVTGMTTTALTATGAVRIAVANTATVRRYVRIATTGTFTSAAFTVSLAKNPVAGVVF
jgi:hypothetical protein